MVSVFEDSLWLKKQLPGTYPFRFLTHCRQHAMVFWNEDKANIKNGYEEKAWTACRICKEHKSKEWFMFWFMVLFNVLWRDLRKMGSWKEELVLVIQNSKWRNSSNSKWWLNTRAAIIHKKHPPSIRIYHYNKGLSELQYWI